MRFQPETEYRLSRVVEMLHLPWEPGLEIPWSWTGEDAPDTLKRPAFFRTYRIHRPIDSVAKKVADTKDVCPICGKWFRNPAAMRLHMGDTHAVEWM
jgi:hypothetical protein